MAWSFVSAGVATIGPSPTIALPAGYAAGDLFVLVINDTSSITIPSAIAGWTLVVRDATNVAVNISVFYKANVSALETSPTFSGGDSACISQILCYRGLTSTPFDAASTLVIQGSNVTTLTTSTLTTTVTNDLVISAYCYDKAIETITTPPTGVTNRVNNLGDGTVSGLWVGDENVASLSTTTARSLVVGTATFGDMIQIAFKQSTGAVASQPSEQDWVEEEQVDDWVELQYDSQPVIANKVLNGLLSNQFEWDWLLDDLIDEFIEWQFDSEPRKTGNNSLLANQDNLEKLFDEPIDDEFWQSIDDGSNVRNANAIASTAYPVEDGWQHFEGEDCADDEWIIRIDEDDGAETDNNPLVASQLDWEWSEEFEDDLVSEDYQNFIAVIIQVQVFDDAWSFDDDIDDEIYVDDYQLISAVQVQATPCNDGWYHEDDIDDEWYLDDYQLIDVAIPVGFPADDSFTHFDEISDDDLVFDDYLNVSAASVITTQPQDIDWLDDDVDDEWLIDQALIADNNPVITSSEDWEWSELFDDELIIDEFQQAIIQAQPSFDDVWPWYEEAEEDWLVDDYQNVNVVINLVSPFPDEWDWQELCDDEWFSEDCQLSIFIPIPPSLVGDYWTVNSRNANWFVDAREKNWLVNVRNSNWVIDLREGAFKVVSRIQNWIVDKR